MPILLPNGTEYVPAGPERVHVVKALDIGSAGGSSTLEALVGASAKDGDREVYWQMYVRHPWVRSCVDLIAQAIAAEGFGVQKVDGENAQSYDAEADPRVKAIHQYFRHAFPKSSLRRELVKASVDNLIFGVAYWRKKRAGKVVVALERLDPRNCTRSKDGTVYILRKPNQPLESAERIPLHDIIEIGNGIGDPNEGGLSPLEALDMTLAADMAVRKHRNAFFSNGATSGTVLVNKSADRKQVEAAEKMMRDEKTGARNAHKVLMLTGDWEVQSMNQTGKQDFDFVKASGISREEVMMVYRVPPGKLFVNDGALGSAGKVEDDATFQQNAVLPLEECIYEALTLQLLSQEFAIADLEMIPKRRATLRIDMFEAAEALVKFGGTANESRALVNLQPLADEGMDKALFITSRQPVLQEEIDAAQAAADTKSTVPDTSAGAKTTKKKKDAAK
jgi:HK97 family phage portal protein